LQQDSTSSVSYGSLLHMQQILAQILHLLHCCKVYNMPLERPMSLRSFRVFTIIQELEFILQLHVTDLV